MKKSESAKAKSEKSKDNGGKANFQRHQVEKERRVLEERKKPDDLTRLGRFSRREAL